MRASLLATLLLVPLLLGCLGNGDPTGAPDAGDAAGGTGFPAAPEPFTYLYCRDGTFQELTGDHADGCDTQLTTDSGPAAEVDVAVNPRDPMNLVVGSKDFTLGTTRPCGELNVWSGVHWSTDGGRTWQHQLLPGHPGDDRRTALSAYDCGSDPVLAFAPNGTLYYASIHVSMSPGEEAPLPQLSPVLGYAIENASLAITRSVDGGQTWEDPVVIDHREDGSLIDKEWLAVDPTTGRLYISYFDTATGTIDVVTSADGGRTWSQPVMISQLGEPPEGPDQHQFAQVGVGPEGTAHVIYWAVRQGQDASAIYHRSSTDGGQTWSPPVQVAVFYPVLDLEVTHDYRIVPLPDLAVSAVDGRLHVAYATPATSPGMQAAGQNLDVYVATSADAGGTWSPPVRVNDDLVGPQNEQWMTTAEVGPDGTLHVTWLDYRDDPSGQAAYVYYAHSTDGGQSFSANGRVSDVPFTEGGDHQSGAKTIGDYMGLAVSEQAVHPVWADTRHGRNDVFSAIIPAG